MRGCSARRGGGREASLEPMTPCHHLMYTRITVFGVLAALLQIACGQTNPKVGTAPIWVLNLAHVEDFPPMGFAGESRIRFVNDQRLILMQSDSAASGGVNLSLLSLNTQSGMPIKTLTRNVQEGDRSTVEIAVVAGGSFIILAGPTMTKFRRI